MRSVQFSIILFCFLVTHHTFAQDENHEEAKHPRSRLGFFIGHTHIPVGFLSTTEKGFFVVPSWGLAYDFRVAEKWSIGLHSEMEIATYAIEHSGGLELERERPIIVVLTAAYNPWKDLFVEAGFGNEFEKHQNFLIYRLGVGYEIEIRNQWDLAPALFVDFKEDIYVSWTLGLQVAKKF